MCEINISYEMDVWCVKSVFSNQLLTCDSNISRVNSMTHVCNQLRTYGINISCVKLTSIVWNQPLMCPIYFWCFKSKYDVGNQFIMYEINTRQVKFIYCCVISASNINFWYNVWNQRMLCVVNFWFVKQNSDVRNSTQIVSSLLWCTHHAVIGHSDIHAALTVLWTLWCTHHAVIGHSDIHTALSVMWTL